MEDFSNQEQASFPPTLYLKNINDKIKPSGDLTRTKNQSLSVVPTIWSRPRHYHYEEKLDEGSGLFGL